MPAQIDLGAQPSANKLGFARLNACKLGNMIIVAKNIGTFDEPTH